MSGDRPFWLPEGHLFHVGSMRRADKGSGSYEGAGLSVSEYPEAWEKIAELRGNPWWTLSKPGATFLDWHRVGETQRGELHRWAIKNGLVEPCLVHSVEFVEDGTAKSFECSTQGMAEAEAAEMNFEDERACASSISSPGFRLTAAGLAACCRINACADETPVLAALLWIEQESSLDGVFWDEELAPELLSAPRAVIVRSRVADWSVRPFAEDDLLCDSYVDKSLTYTAERAS